MPAAEIYSYLEHQAQQMERSYSWELWGAAYVTLVCLLPEFLISWGNVPFYFGGTSLLIVIGVALDTVSQIESHLIQGHYGGFLKGVTVKGRR